MSTGSITASAPAPVVGLGGQDLEEHSGHKLTPLMSFTNILADLSPHGMLPLAYGLASSPGSTGALSSFLILTTFALLGWYSLHSMARAKVLSSSHPSTDSLQSVHSSLPFSSTAVRTSLLPTLFPLLLTSGCCLFYSAFLGDILTPLLTATTGLTLSRSQILTTLSLTLLLPLCLQNDLSCLQTSSIAGLLGVLYTVAFLFYHAFLSKTYHPNGSMYNLMKDLGHTHLHLLSNPLPPTPLLKVSKGTLNLMNMACVAFACHYNGVKYYNELDNPIHTSTKNSDVTQVNKYSKIMLTSFLSTLLIFLTTMYSGAMTFGSSSQALILNNFHPNLDKYASLARFGTAVAIVSGYPLMFSGYRSALFDLFNVNAKRDENARKIMSVASLTAFTVGACFVTEHELGTILGVVGAVFGSGVVYVLPGVWNMCAGEKMRLFRGERGFNVALIAAGIVLAGMGSYVSLCGV
jgi:amino acid permease